MLTRRVLLGCSLAAALPQAASAETACLAPDVVVPFGEPLPPPTDPSWAVARMLLDRAPTGPTPYAVAQYLLSLPWANRHDTGYRNPANPLIVDLFRDTGLQGVGDATPWCAVFVNWCMARCNVDGTDSAWAQSFSDWGEQVWAAGQPHLLRLARPGDIAVFRQAADPCKGHVAFVNGFQSAHVIEVLGGNQSMSQDGVHTFGAIDVKALNIDDTFKLLSIRRQS